MKYASKNTWEYYTWYNVQSIVECFYLKFEKPEKTQIYVFCFLLFACLTFL